MDTKLIYSIGVERCVEKFNKQDRLMDQMGIYTTKPVKELTNKEFKGVLNSKTIDISPHALNHLSANQRKVFKEEELINMIKRENSRKIYLQENGRYAAYYRRRDGYRKIIIELDKKKVVIVSFMDTSEIPKIRI